MMPRAKAPTRRARVVAEEDAHAAEPRRLVDLGRDEAHGAGDLAEAGDLDARGLADLDGGHARLGDLGVELDLALGDDAEHRLGGARGVAADARHAAADDAVGRRQHLGAAAPPVSSRRCASTCAFSASATFRPSRAATSCASAVRAACSRWSKALSAMWPAPAQRLGPLEGVARSRRAAPRPARWRSWPGRWRRRRAPCAASFWATWASSVSATSRASTSPFFTRMPSSASTSVTRRPSTSGPTRISSRATSEPVASTVSVKSAGATRATVTAAASASALSCGILGGSSRPGRSARGSDLPTSVSEIISEGRARARRRSESFS